jgi:chromate transporter
MFRPDDHGVSLREALGVWLRVAALSFGGPAGQIAVMHRIIVEEKKWLGEARFLHALSYCTLLPGPEAQQLATYIGWLMHRTLGGVIAGVLFVLPGVAAIMALSWLYAVWGMVPAVGAFFFGLKAAVLAVVAQAALRVGRKALRGRGPVVVAALAFVAIFFFGAPFPLIVLAAGLFGWLAGRAGWRGFAAAPHGGDAGDGSLLGDTMPAHATLASAFRAAAVCLVLWAVPVAWLVLAQPGSPVFPDIAVFFSQLAVVTFGGAYAVLAYMAQQAVENWGWLTAGEMLDGLGMAETTPGPLIMVVQFVAFMGAFRDPGALPPLLAGTLGGLLATWVTFVPCFLWIFLGAPFVERLRRNAALAGALAAITAAVVGVIANLALWFAVHTWFRATVPVRAWGLDFAAPVPASLDPWAAGLSLMALVAVFRLRWGMLTTLGGAALAGLALYGLGRLSGLGPWAAT